MRIESAELGNGAVHHRRNLGVIAHVAADCDRLVTGGYHPLSLGFHRFRFEICEHDGGTRFGERLCRRQSHTRGCSRDKCYFVLKRQVHGEPCFLVTI